MPRLTPEDSAFPIPRTSTLFLPLRLPTVTQIFVVPISRPTTIGVSLLVNVLFSIFIKLYFRFLISNSTIFHFFHIPIDSQSLNQRNDKHPTPRQGLSVYKKFAICRIS